MPELRDCNFLGITHNFQCWDAVFSWQHLLILPVFTFVSAQSGKGVQDFSVIADPWDSISWQQQQPNIFSSPFLRVALVFVWHYMGPTPGLVSCMSWFTSGTLDSMILVHPFQPWIFSASMIVIKPSSLMSATLVQQGEHKHADKGGRWHCPCSWQLAIGAICLYYPNMSFSVLS